MTVPRRVALAAGLTALGAIAAACTAATRPQALSADSTPSSAGPGTPNAASTAAGSGAARSSTVTGPPTRTAATSSTLHAAPPASSEATTAQAGATPTAANGSPAVEVVHGPRTRNEVALTFHGAGDVDIARQLLGIFAAQRAAVTVLAVGTWLSANPWIGREIVDAGHELGNHTYTHPDLAALSVGDVRDEIVRCRDLLSATVGSGGAHFRPSQAVHSSPLVRQVAGAAGYRTVLSYDVDSLDYTDPGPDAVRAAVATAQPGSIVSMHFGHRDTVAAMPLILADLASRGLTAVTTTRLLRP